LYATPKPAISFKKSSFWRRKASDLDDSCCTHAIDPNIAALCPILLNDEKGRAGLKIPLLLSAIAPAEPGA